MIPTHRTWYLTLLAAYYLVICTIGVLLIIASYFQPFAIHSPRELLTLAGALAGGAYFCKPAWGHKALLALTIVTLLALGESDPAATAFHAFVLILLLLPLRRGVAMSNEQ